MRSSLLHRLSIFSRPRLRVLVACGCLLNAVPGSHAASNDAAAKLTIQVNVVPVIQNTAVSVMNSTAVSSRGTGTVAFVVPSDSGSQISAQLNVHQVSFDDSQTTGSWSLSAERVAESTLETVTFVEK